jgi:hypothetical protein
MLEINYVNLPRPHENAQVHMQAVFQLRCDCCSLPHKVRGERWGAVPHRVSPEERQEQTACYPTTQGHSTHPSIGGWYPIDQPLILPCWT